MEELLLNPVCSLARPSLRTCLRAQVGMHPHSQQRHVSFTTRPRPRHAKQSHICRAGPQEQLDETKASPSKPLEAPSDESEPESVGDAAAGAGQKERKRDSLDVDKVERILRGLQSAMEDERKAFKGERFLELLVSLGGLKGTLAVVVAALLSLDPFGNIHWDPTDIAVGLTLSIPIYVTDAALMLPDYPSDPRSAQKIASSKRSRSTPESSESIRETLEELKEVAKPMSIQERMVAAASLFQRIKVTQNPGSGLDHWQEVAIVLVGHLADEMFARAVVLGGLSLWFRDRFVEADIVDFQAASSLSPWAALGALILFEVVRKQRSLLNKINLNVGAARVEQDKITGRSKVTYLSDQDLLKVPDSQRERERAVRVAVQIRDAKERTVVAAQIEAIRTIGEVVCLGSAFAVTNNLAASLAASTLADLLFSSYQRMGAARLKAKEETAMQRVLSKMREKEARRRAKENESLATANDADDAAVGRNGDTHAAEGSSEGQKDANGTSEGVQTTNKEASALSDRSKSNGDESAR